MKGIRVYYMKSFPFGFWLLFVLLVIGCSEPLEWPVSPLYDWGEPSQADSISEEEARQALLGRFAHYDVVAYEDNNLKTPMKTFIISYGFTEFFEQGGRLYQKDTFCRATHIINQKGVESRFSDAAVQAIQPRVQEVELFQREGKWMVYRPPSPTLLGIDGDPDAPLSRDPQDPALSDPDGDGNPGVTVELVIGGFLKGEIYITRREIYENYLSLYPDGSWGGYVKDSSEQFVVGATMKVLRQQSESVQVDDYGLSPMLLIPVEDDFTCEDLLKAGEELFPPEPEFH